MSCLFSGGWTVSVKVLRSDIIKKRTDCTGGSMAQNEPKITALFIHFCQLCPSSSNLSEQDFLLPSAQYENQWWIVSMSWEANVSHLRFTHSRQYCGQGGELQTPSWASSREAYSLSPQPVRSIDERVTTGSKDWLRRCQNTFRWVFCTMAASIQSNMKGLLGLSQNGYGESQRIPPISALHESVTIGIYRTQVFTSTQINIAKGHALPGSVLLNGGSTYPTLQDLS